MCNALQDSLKICKAFVLGRIRNLLWSELAKEGSIAHITPIPSRHYCAQVIAVSQKNCVNLRYVWPLYSKLLFLFLCLCYATAQKGTWNKGAFTLLSHPSHPWAASGPSLGTKFWTCLSREDVTSTGKGAKGMVHSRKWQQKTRAGQGKERWWQTGNKRRANQKTVLQLDLVLPI